MLMKKNTSYYLDMILSKISTTIQFQVVCLNAIKVLLSALTIKVIIGTFGKLRFAVALVKQLDPTLFIVIIKDIDLGHDLEKKKRNV